jgi:hypothetical protein
MGVPVEGWPLTTPGSSTNKRRPYEAGEKSLVKCFCPVGLTCGGDYARVRTRVKNSFVRL